MMAGLILYLFNFSIVFVYSISQTQCNHDFYCPQQGFEFSAIWNKLFEEEVVSEKVTNMLRPMPFKLRLSLIPINSRITFNYIEHLIDSSGDQLSHWSIREVRYGEIASSNSMASR